jgi:hypothetical protein
MEGAKEDKVYDSVRERRGWLEETGKEIEEI